MKSPASECARPRAQQGETFGALEKSTPADIPTLLRPGTGALRAKQLLAAGPAIAGFQRGALRDGIVLLGVAGGNFLTVDAALDASTKEEQPTFNSPTYPLRVEYLQCDNLRSARK